MKLIYYRNSVAYKLSIKGLTSLIRYFLKNFSDKYFVIYTENRFNLVKYTGGEIFEMAKLDSFSINLIDLGESYLIFTVDENLISIKLKNIRNISLGGNGTVYFNENFTKLLNLPDGSDIFNKDELVKILKEYDITK